MRTIPFVLLAIAALGRSSLAVQFNVGDIVAPQFDNDGMIVVVHASTGNRETLSLYPGIGSGPRMARPTSIAVLPDGDFLVTEAFVVNGLYRIDRETGNRSFLSGNGSFSVGYPATRGTGPVDHPMAVLRTIAGETILVNQGGADFTSGFVTRVDPATGDRTLISGLGTGTGPAFDSPQGGAIDGSGELVVADYGQKAIFKVDLTTGERSILSGPGRGTGPALANVRDLVILPSGQIIASDINFDGIPLTNSLVRIDPLTGDRTVIGTNPYADYDYTRIALGSNGQLLGSVSRLGAIFSIDPSNGARTLVSGDGLGSGPELFWGDMVVVPEPSAIALFAVGTVLLLVTRFRPRSRLIRLQTPPRA